MSCSYTDYSSLGSCLIVWLLVFLAPLDLFSRMLPHSEISAITSPSTVLIELMARATQVKNPHVKDLAKLAAQLERLLLQNEPLLCGRCSDKTWKHGITNLQPEADGGFYNCVCVWGDNESLIVSFCLCCQICFWNTVGRVSINMFFRAFWNTALENVVGHSQIVKKKKKKLSQFREKALRANSLVCWLLSLIPSSSHTDGLG